MVQCGDGGLGLVQGCPPPVFSTRLGAHATPALFIRDPNTFSHSNACETITIHHPVLNINAIPIGNTITNCYSITDCLSNAVTNSVNNLIVQRDRHCVRHPIANAINGSINDAVNNAIANTINYAKVHCIGNADGHAAWGSVCNCNPIHNSIAHVISDIITIFVTHPFSIHISY